VRDDGLPPIEARSGKGRILLGRGIERFRAIPWRNAASLKWWVRGFNRTYVQSGRLTTLLALIGVLAIQLDDPNILKLVRARVFDFYQQTKPRPLTEASPVVIIDIDEKSLAELGQWQWPRTIIADLITRATELGVDVIGFDVTWPDRCGDTNPPAATADQRQTPR
jgi:CHASE2 domain-containing sensor protein